MTENGDNDFVSIKKGPLIKAILVISTISATLIMTSVFSTKLLTPIEGQEDNSKSECKGLVNFFKNLLKVKDSKLADFTTVTCPNNGLNVLLPLISDTEALGQICSPQLRQDAIAKLTKLQDCQAGRCPECRPCENRDPKLTTCVSSIPVTYQCADLSSDAERCGNCKTNCATTYGTGATCNSGVCGCPTDQELFNGACVPKCPTGATRDSSGQCHCPPGQQPQNGQCVVVACDEGFSFDSACGACTRTCSGDTVLVSGNACLPRCQPLNGFCFVETGPTTYKKCPIAPGGGPSPNGCFQSDVNRCTFGPSPPP